MQRVNRAPAGRDGATDDVGTTSTQLVLQVGVAKCPSQKVRCANVNNGPSLSKFVRVGQSYGGKLCYGFPRKLHLILLLFSQTFSSHFLTITLLNLV